VLNILKLVVYKFRSEHSISLASGRGSLYCGTAIACVIRLCASLFVLNRIILGLEHKPKQVSTFFIKEINKKKKETQF